MKIPALNLILDLLGAWKGKIQIQLLVPSDRDFGASGRVLPAGTYDVVWSKQINIKDLVEMIDNPDGDIVKVPRDHIDQLREGIKHRDMAGLWTLLENYSWLK